MKKVKNARLLGIENDTDNRFKGERSWDFDVKDQGFRYHMSDIMAAIGIAQFERINQFEQKRKKIFRIYLDTLTGVGDIAFLNFVIEDVFPHIVVIKTNKRDELRKYLITHNIECGLHYKPNHLLSKYEKTKLPITEAIYSKTLTLPCHFDLSTEDQNYIIKTIKTFYDE